MMFVTSVDLFCLYLHVLYTFQVADFHLRDETPFEYDTLTLHSKESQQPDNRLH